MLSQQGTSLNKNYFAYRAFTCLAPYIVELSFGHLIHGVLATVAGILYYIVLPETKGKLLPEKVADVMNLYDRG